MFRDSDVDDSSASTSTSSRDKFKQQPAHNSPDYGTTEPAAQHNSPGYATSESDTSEPAAQHNSPGYATSESDTNEPIAPAFSTIQKANDNYSPPYSTTEPASPMKGGKPVVYQKMGLGYIRECCQEAIHIFETISMVFDK